MAIYVEDGTPVGGASLCETCSYGFIARGYRQNEMLIVCQATWPQARMAFPIRVCSRYIEKNRPTIREMEEIALVLDRVALKRDAGFVRVGEGETEAGVEKIELVLNSNE